MTAGIEQATLEEIAKGRVATIIEIRFMEERGREPIRIAVNEFTIRIRSGAGVLINGESYRVQGEGFRYDDNERRDLRTICVSTPEFYRESSGVLMRIGPDTPDLHITYDVTDFILQ